MNARRFFTELKRRKVYRVAAGYAVLAWLLIQIATQVFPFFEIPTWAVRMIIVALVLGFPVALLLSWAFDLTPGGVVRTEDLEPTRSLPPLVRPEPPEKSIAVLPFENFSDDQQNAYFADGIQDDILSSLAKLADLKVISRTSVRQYRTGTRNLREIGEALGVAYVMEGTVRREANRVRINAQLIDARTDLHVWSDTYDREISDLFALQTELARRIAFALRANLSPREKASLQVHSTNDLDAYDLFLRARDLFRWSGSGDPRENGERALRLLDDAIARDPHFALAHCLASRFHGELYWFGYDRSRSRLTQAKLEADKDSAPSVYCLSRKMLTRARSSRRNSRRSMRISAKQTEPWICSTSWSPFRTDRPAVPCRSSPNGIRSGTTPDSINCWRGSGA